MLDDLLASMQTVVRYAGTYKNLLRYGAFLKTAPERNDIIDFAKKSCRMLYLSEEVSSDFLEAAYNLNRASYEYFDSLKNGFTPKVKDCEQFASSTALFAKKMFNSVRDDDLELRRDWCKKWLKYESEAYSKNKSNFFYEFSISHAGLSLFEVNKKLLYDLHPGRERESLISESIELLEKSIYAVKDAIKRFGSVIITETDLSNCLIYEEKYKHYLTVLLKLELSKARFFQKINAPIRSDSLDFVVESAEIMMDEHLKRFILYKAGDLMKLFGRMTNDSELQDNGYDLMQKNFYLDYSPKTFT